MHGQHPMGGPGYGMDPMMGPGGMGPPFMGGPGQFGDMGGMGPMGMGAMFPCVKLRGLPFDVSDDDIRMFLVGGLGRWAPCLTHLQAAQAG